jgi:hypothetical protein
MNYERYIRSSQWKEKRDMRLAIDGHRCVRCGVSDERLEVHHKTYERFGAEEIADLETLCVRCHDVETDRMRRISYGKKFAVLKSGHNPLRENEHAVVASEFDAVPELGPVVRDGVEMFGVACSCGAR